MTRQQLSNVVNLTPQNRDTPWSPTSEEAVPGGGRLLEVIPLPDTDTVMLIVAHVVPASSAPGLERSPRSEEGEPEVGGGALSSLQRADDWQGGGSAALAGSASDEHQGVGGLSSQHGQGAAGASWGEVEKKPDAGVAVPLGPRTGESDSGVGDSSEESLERVPPLGLRLERLREARTTYGVRRKRSRSEDGAEGVVPPSEGVFADRDSRRAWADGREMELTYQEFELLDHLISNPWTVFTRTDLMTDLWPAGDATPRTVDVHIHRLRRKLGVQGEQLATVRRVGYVYRPAGAVAEE